MKELSIPSVVAEIKSLVSSVRQNSLALAKNLHFLRSNLPDERPFGQFVEEEFEISQGFASKLVSNWEHYVITGGVQPSKLEQIDYEKLYLAAKIEGSPELQIAQAKTLSRKELRQTREETNDHEHEEIRVCRICGIRICDGVDH